MPGKSFSATLTLLAKSTSNHIQLLATLWSVAHQAPLFMGFPRQKYCIYTMEHYLVICREVDGPTDCLKECSKLKTEKQILSVNTWMWILEKWYR